MLAYKFETEIPESGLLEIPQEILDKIKHLMVEIVILRNDSIAQTNGDVISSLMGKYKGCLSTTDEFSKCKTLEKEMEL